MADFIWNEWIDPCPLLPYKAFIANMLKTMTYTSSRHEAILQPMNLETENVFAEW